MVTLLPYEEAMGGLDFVLQMMGYIMYSAGPQKYEVIREEQTSKPPWYRFWSKPYTSWSIKILDANKEDVSGLRAYGKEVSDMLFDRISVLVRAVNEVNEESSKEGKGNGKTKKAKRRQAPRKG